MIEQIPSCRNFRCKVCLILFAFFSALTLSAQQYHFENFTLESGLPQVNIYCIFQDSRGYLWLGTEGSGACRFDGKNFKAINREKGMAGDIVRNIIEDKQGRLWFGTDAGVTVYDGNNFITIDEERGLSSNTVVCLYRDKTDSIWVGTAGDKGGLNKIEFLSADSVKIKKYTVDNGLSNNSVFGLCEDDYGRLWVGTFGGGITILSKDGSTTPVVLNTLHNFPSDYILKISPDSLNILWIGTYDKGVLKISVTEDLRYSRIEQLSKDLNFPNKTVWNIMPFHDKIWFGTNENGLVRYDGKRLSTINNLNGLLQNQVMTIFTDREQNLWVSCSDGGISRYLGDRFYSITKKDGLTDENIYSVAISGEGYVWAGTYGKGLFRISCGQNKISLKNYTIKDGLPDDIINSLAFDKYDNLWIATPSGVAKFDGRHFLVFNEEKDGLANNYVNTICVDKDNIVWCGTKRGISIYDGVGFKNVRKGYLPNNEVQTIIQDRSGNIWCGTLDGLGRITGGMLTTFDEEEGLNHKKIYSLAEDKKGDIWIGTFGGGIYRLSVNQGNKMPVIQMATDSLLTSLNIYSLIFQNDTTLLAGTDDGMNRIILDNNSRVKRIFNYTLKDGFSGIKTNLNAVVRKGNEIWFGTVNGITVYRPDEDKQAISKPLIQITDVKLFFNEVDWKKENYEIIPWTRLPRGLKLSYKNNHLTFQYIGLLFGDKEEIKYQYMLEGLDKGWSPPRKENEAVYPGLSPGEYTFKVVALDRYGNRSNETASFSFIITPPFWKTSWFYIVCAIIALSLIVTYIKYRERKLRNERDHLEHVVKERTAEVVRQKDQIESQRDEIQRQHNIVTEQKKDIMDSIQYAKRIQTAAIPSPENVINELKDLFILYKPRDVVSGDFYWMGIEDEKIIMIAADCTGHGVPGAFTSMLGISMLNDIIGQESTTSPDIILNELRNNIVRSLKQTPGGESKDGMDIAILTIDKKKNELDFAGAMNPLFIIRDANLKSISDSCMEEGTFRLYEIKGDKMPAAIHDKMDPFTKITVKVEPDDKFYMFSDGYEDQFGGPGHHKLMRKNFKKLLLQIHHLPMAEQKQILEKTIEEWRGDLPQVDDILVIGFSV
jgi:ligand-binding sensor domain-containing protein/serine phosphatase RsbU (regulator of sigma subunit)